MLNCMPGKVRTESLKVMSGAEIARVAVKKKEEKSEGTRRFNYNIWNSKKEKLFVGPISH